MRGELQTSAEASAEALAEVSAEASVEGSMADASAEAATAGEALPPSADGRRPAEGESADPSGSAGVLDAAPARVLDEAPPPAAVAANGHAAPATNGARPAPPTEADRVGPAADEGVESRPEAEARAAPAADGTAADAAGPAPTAEKPPAEPRANAEVIRIYCLGQLRVFRGDVELTRPGGVEEGALVAEEGQAGPRTAHPKMPFRRKARELLAYFAAYPHLDLARDRIQEAIWPDDGNEKSGKALRQNLWILRQHLAGGEARRAGEGDCISQQGGVYRLEAGRFWIDSQEFQRLVARSDRLERSAPAEAAALRDRAIDLYRGD